jgi:exonuclease III
MTTQWLWETLTPHYCQYIGHLNKKINEKIQDLKYAIDQMDLVDVYRTFHPTSTQNTFFSAAHGTFSKIDHILGHKASLSKYKKREIIPCILSDHNAVKVELNNKSKDKNMQTAGT